MATASIQIGNSDNKLTQNQWSQFIYEIHRIIDSESNYKIHFSGYSDPRAPWQNACWVFEVPDNDALLWLNERLAIAARNHRQDTIALTIGKTKLVPAKRI